MRPAPGLLPALAAAGALAACGGTADRDVGSALRPVEAIPPLTTYVYRCSDDGRVVAHHDRADSVWLFLPSGTVRLGRTETASGARYGEGNPIWWAKGREATLERGPDDRATCTEDRRQSVIEDAKLRGADFWAVGNEPGWTLEIAADSIRWVTGYATEHYRFATPEPQVDQGRSRTVWQARASDHDLTITIEGGGCSDSMSGETFPVAVVLRFDDRDYPGCGTPLH